MDNHILSQNFYTLEAAIAESLPTADAFREGYASGVEAERKRAYKAKVARQMVKPTRWQLLKFKWQTLMARRANGES